MSASARKTAVVLGVGPGLGMSLAHRFGREGYAVALVSRTDARHPGYLAALAEAGIEAGSFVADVRDREQIRSVLEDIATRYGSIDVLYYGPAPADQASRLAPIAETDSTGMREAMSWVYPAVDVVNEVLPGMVERGDGGLLFAGGLSAVVPMPALGGLTLSSAALRNYAVTLNAGLAEQGVYAGVLTIGGLIERGDIYQMVQAEPAYFGDFEIKSLDPDDIADAAWEQFSQRDRAETVFNAFA